MALFGAIIAASGILMTIVVVTAYVTSIIILNGTFPEHHGVAALGSGSGDQAGEEGAGFAVNAGSRGRNGHAGSSIGSDLLVGDPEFHGQGGDLGQVLGNHVDGVAGVAHGDVGGAHGHTVEGNGGGGGGAVCAGLGVDRDVGGSPGAISFLGPNLGHI